MKSRVRRIGALIIGVVIASVLLFSLHQLSSVEANDPLPSFNPTSSIVLSTTAATGNPTHTTEFNLPTGDVNFAGSGAALVTFLPSQWCIASHTADCHATPVNVPIGAITGTVVSFTRLGLTPVPPSSSGLDTPCNQPFPVTFPDFVESVPDFNFNDVAGTTVAPLAPGSTNSLNPLALDGPNVNGIPDYADRWPTFLTTLLDKNGGTANDGDIVFPIARYAADTDVAGTDVVLQTLVFNPGDLTQFVGAPWDSFDASLGYPLLTVLQNPLEANNGTIADFCTDLTSVTDVFGVTLSNSTPCRLCGATAAAVTGGQFLHQNSAANSGIGNTGTHIYRLIAQGGRDLDQDSYENAFDTCPSVHNTDGDPRTNLGTDLDGLDSACDPDTATVCSLPCDQDNDGWSNRLDNCPLVMNANQADQDVPPGTAVAGGGPPFDEIGDACDAQPNIPNGGFLDAVVKSFACNGSADTDDDGWCADREAGVGGTSTSLACAVNSGPDNDSVSDAAVPVDFNDDRVVNIGDRGRVVNAVLGFPSADPGGHVAARYDLNSDTFVNILDRAATVASIGWTCTP